MAIFNKTAFDSNSAGSFARSTSPMMQHVGEFTLRAGNQYLDVKTDLATESAMLFYFCWGYFYNNGNMFSWGGSYPYTGTSILNNYIGNSAQVTLSSVYKTGSPYYVCFKFNRNDSGYTEGKVNLFMSCHGLDFGRRINVLAFAQNNTAGAYYS